MPRSHAVQTNSDPTRPRSRDKKPETRRDLGRYSMRDGIPYRTISPLLQQPGTLTPRRGRPKAATTPAFFELMKKFPRDRSGPPCALETISVADLNLCLLMVRGGVTPHVAAKAALGVSYSSWRRWCEELEGPEPRDPIKVEFFARLERAAAAARGEAECSVFVADPATYLTRGPEGRTRPGLPGWTDEKIVRHADETGDGPVRVVLEITAQGAKTHITPTSAGALMPGSEDEDPDASVGRSA